MALADIPSRSWASWRAFHPDEADEKYQGHGWYESVMKAPIYRRGLCTALLHEGMRRLVERGAVHACLGGGGEANPVAEGVYSRAATDEDSYVTWLKYFDGKPA